MDERTSSSILAAGETGRMKLDPHSIYHIYIYISTGI
jgi:hypothetical protein